MADAPFVDEHAAVEKLVPLGLFNEANDEGEIARQIPQTLDVGTVGADRRAGKALAHGIPAESQLGEDEKLDLFFLGALDEVGNRFHVYGNVAELTIDLRDPDSDRFLWHLRHIPGPERTTMWGLVLLL